MCRFGLLSLALCCLILCVVPVYAAQDLSILYPNIVATGGVKVANFRVTIKAHTPTKKTFFVDLIYRGKPITSLKSCQVSGIKQKCNVQFSLTMPKTQKARTYHYHIHVNTGASIQKNIVNITVYPAFYEIPTGPGQKRFEGIKINDIFVWHDLLYLATDKGLAVSKDNGSTWHMMTQKNGLSSNQINQVYRGGQMLALATENGLSLSNDGGKRWRAINRNNGLSNNMIYGVAVHKDTLYAATENGLDYSTDNGAIWHQISKFKHFAVSRIYFKGSTVYVATTNGLYIQRKNKNWYRCSDKNGLASNIILGFAYDGPRLYAATTNGLAISLDDGQHWQNKTVREGLGSSIVRDVSVWHGTIYAATNDGLSVSDDQGKSWITWTTKNGLNSDVVLDVARDDHDNLYVATVNGLAKWGKTLVYQNVVNKPV